MSTVFIEKGRLDTAAASDVGHHRKNNEDALLMIPKLGCFVVSDGMGGASAGEVASGMVVAAIEKALSKEERTPSENANAVLQACYKTNADVQAYAENHHFEAMGATLVCLMLDTWRPANAVLFHAGDSRAYRFRDNRLELLTEDHTIASASNVSETALAPKLRGVLTDAVGNGTDFYVDRTEVEIRHGDCYILCSDGLSRMASDEDIQNTCLLYGDETAKVLCDSLIQLALKRGGRDNVSVIVVKVVGWCRDYIPTRPERDRDREAEMRMVMDLTDTPVTEIGAVNQEKTA